MVTRAGRGLGRAGAANPKSFVALVLVLILAGAGGLAYLTGRQHGPAATIVSACRAPPRITATSPAETIVSTTSSQASAGWPEPSP